MGRVNVSPVVCSDLNHSTTVPLIYYRGKLNIDKVTTVSANFKWRSNFTPNIWQKLKESKVKLNWKSFL